MGPETIKFSVIVCTYNRLEYLKKCVAALLELDYPDYEIVIVNDCSTDGTKNFLDSINNDKITVVHHQQNQQLSIARNTGIKNSKNDYLAFTDDDCMVDTNWLAELAKKFTDEKIGFVIGQLFYIKKGYVGYFPERLVSNIGARWPMGANVSYRRTVFEKCGGFDPFFVKYTNEDTEMAIRTISNGFLFARASEAIIFHQAINWTVVSLLRSARNASVAGVLKKRYPKDHAVFGPNILFGCIVNPKDYIYMATAPIFIPLLFIRYLWHGKRDIKIFFAKWPVYLFLRRFYVYREAIKNKIFMI